MIEFFIVVGGFITNCKIEYATVELALLLSCIQTL